MGTTPSDPMIRKVKLGFQVMFQNLYIWLKYGIYNSIVVRDIRFLFSSDIPQKLPKTTRMGHPIGIVIGGDVTIGDSVTIYQNVTIGRSNKNTIESPTIGDDVTIYSGAAILGNVTIGDGAVIAANSVVLNDVPQGAVVAGVPAHIISVE